MKKVILIAVIIVVGMAAGGVIFYYSTKSHSPEANTVFEDGDLKISVFYNQPFKKGRKIFGGLVPYGKTWRTGANEATVIETNRSLLIGDKKIPPGRYSLWTVPNEQSWTVILNSTIPPWGIDVMKDGQAAREESTDVVVTEVPVVHVEKEFEQFTISIDKTDDMLELVLAWDTVLVAVPFSVSE